MIKYDWMHWFCYALYWLISISHDYVFFYRIRIRNMIYEEFWFKNDMNWQPDYVKDLTNRDKYIGNWFVLKIYVTSEISNMSPVRSIINHQRDQQFWRTLLSDNSQPTVRWYAVLWSCHRKNMVIAHGWWKELENERNWNLERSSIFLKKNEFGMNYIV